MQQASRRTFVRSSPATANGWGRRSGPMRRGLRIAKYHAPAGWPRPGTCAGPAGAPPGGFKPSAPRRTAASPRQQPPDAMRPTSKRRTARPCATGRAVAGIGLRLQFGGRRCGTKGLPFSAFLRYWNKNPPFWRSIRSAETSAAAITRPGPWRAGARYRSTGFRTRHTQQIVVIVAAQAAGAVRVQGLIRPPRDAQSLSHSVAWGHAQNRPRDFAGNPRNSRAKQPVCTDWWAWSPR